ncbi:placenta-specific gene 8 protein [Exaiptasia diaphana]|uniref:Uncharacterized protein n=1 Tax=Exaiptasia diaphana TaxID=2652724 RepID=A0A913X5A9_EXADI|nr:placenta-specific gene 8 protein [Exaiptasia diaphana]XP_028514537.1 placenta-specific gene 8 protein [Exaiptasia diaphana]
MDNPTITTEPTAPPTYPDQGYIQAGYPQQGYPPPQGYPGPQPYPPSHQTTTNVTVIQQQPTVKQPRKWSSGMCGCFEDCGSCFLGMCCPSCLLTEVSSRMGEGCCFTCCCPGSLLGLRIKLRVENNIQGSLMDDYCAVMCCPLCVLCQLSRELKSLGR